MIAVLWFGLGPNGLAVDRQSLINRDSFEWLGTFRLPKMYPAADEQFPSGLTHRRVQGRLQLLTFCKGLPTNKQTPSRAQLIAIQPPRVHRAGVVDVQNCINYGDIAGPELRSPSDAYWDRRTRKLWWVDRNGYNAAAVDQSIGVCRLDDKRRRGQSVGRFGLPLSYKAIKGLCEIPPPATARLGRRYTIAAGFGGYESVISAGPAVLGPVLMAFDPMGVRGVRPGRSLATGDVRGLIAPPRNDPMALSSRGRRDRGYHVSFDRRPGKPRRPGGGVGDATNDGPGRWTWGDNVAAGGVWVETPSHRGFMIFNRIVGGGQRSRFDPAVPPRRVGEKTFVVTLSRPLAEVRIDDIIACRIAEDRYVSATVIAIAERTLTLRMIPSGHHPDPVPAGLDDGDADVFRGGWYHRSTRWATTGRTVAMVYDPLKFATGDVGDAQESGSVAALQFDWPLPGLDAAYGSWRDVGPGTVTGVTFDPVDDRLYLIYSPGLVSVYQLR